SSPPLCELAGLTDSAPPPVTYASALERLDVLHEIRDPQFGRGRAAGHRPEDPAPRGHLAAAMFEHQRVAAHHIAEPRLRELASVVLGEHGEVGWRLLERRGHGAVA